MNQTITPYITVKGAAKAIDFYKKAFGAVEAPRVTQSRAAASATRRSRSAAHESCCPDEHPEIDVSQSAIVRRHARDVPSARRRRSRDRCPRGRRGREVQRAVEVQPYGERSGTIKDPFGHRWMIATHDRRRIERRAPEARRRRLQDQSGAA